MSVVLGLPTFAQPTRDINYAGEGTSLWGTNKKETYDLAVYLNDAKLVGSEIVGVELPSVVATGTDNWSVWLSSTLALENKLNVADITSVSATPVDGKISVTFDEPYVIPENGVYVGYSFDVTELSNATKQPVSVGPSSNSAAFNVHTTKTYLKWREAGNDLALNLTIRVRGDFSEDAVSLVAMSECGDVHGVDLQPVVTLKNVGVNNVSSIKYSWTFNGETKSDVKTFSPALSSQSDESVEFTFTLPGVADAGTYPCTVEVTEVNGHANAATDATLTTDMYVYPYGPTHMPLVEEYTGTWCGWCPRGTVAFDGLKNDFGDKFIAVVYHINDILTISPNPYVANSGVPGAYINRGGFLDPYYGSLSEGDAANCLTYKQGIKQDWKVAQAQVPVADMALEARWADDDKTSIEATSTVKFMRAYSDADFRLMYILVNEEVSGSGRGWYQKNYYSGGEAYRETDLAYLVDQPDRISDITFHDVAILAPDTYGIEGSLPTEIPYLESLTHIKTLQLSEAVTTPPEEYATVSIDLVQDKTKLVVVASVYDAKTGRVVNSRKVRVQDNSSIDTVQASTETEAQWYTLQGVRVDEANLASGVYIRRVGAEVSKVFVR